MTHPVELLASYVDDAVAPSERMLVESHLADCAVCRGELAAASAALEVLRSMPAPSSVPSDLGAPALAEMQRARAAPATSRWARLMPVAAAAAIVALVVLIVPRIGSDEARRTIEAADGALAAAPSGELRLVASDVDLDPASLEAAAEAFVTQQRSAADGQPATEASTVTAPTQARTLSTAKTNEALRCLRAAFTGFPGQVVRLERVTFDGKPAFLAYVLEGPGAGQPPDTMTLWVAAARDCSILSLTSSTLT